MFNSISIQLKLFITYFVTIVVFFVIIMVAYTQQVAGFLTDELQKTTALAIQENVHLVENDLQKIEKDITFLSGIDSFSTLMNVSENVDASTYNEYVDDVENDFLRISEVNTHYIQLRYIDENGMEIIRINSSDTVQQIVPASQLQDKSDRYYFIQANQLQKNEIYTSSIDLNREGDQSEIQRPYQPVIRYAIPVFDDNNFRKGIIIANVDFNLYLQELRSNFLTGVLYVMDKQGYYLVNTYNAVKEWGSPQDLGTAYSFSDDRPEEASRILSGGLGSIEYDGGVIAFNTISTNSSDPAQYIIIASQEQSASIYNVLYEKLRVIIFVAVAVLLCILIIVLYLLRKSLRPLIQLTDAAIEIGKGHFRERVHITSNDEVGRLAQSFNAMASSLEEANEKIEERVTQRTKELESINDLMVDRELRMIELKKQLDECTTHCQYRQETEGDSDVLEAQQESLDSNES